MDPKVRLQFNVVGVVLSGVLDVTLAMIPWKILKNLHMESEEKLGVGLAMSTGVLAGIAAFTKAASIATFGTQDFNCKSSAPDSLMGVLHS